MREKRREVKAILFIGSMGDAVSMGCVSLITADRSARYRFQSRAVAATNGGHRLLPSQGENRVDARGAVRRNVCRD
jgi:hypothetical protein